MAVPQSLTAKLLQVAILWLAVALPAFAADAAATEESAGHHGRGVFSEFQMNYYLGELLAEEIAESEEGIAIPDNATMRLTVIVDEWSKRRFSQYWSQALLINNSADQRSRLSRDIQAWHKAFKGGLVKGDQLVLKKTPKHFETRLNGISLMKTTNEEVFNLFLNVWVGARPPSSEFKASILGQSDHFASVFDEHAELKPAAGRTRTILDWRKPTARKPVAAKPAPVVAQANEPAAPAEVTTDTAVPVIASEASSTQVTDSQAETADKASIEPGKKTTVAADSATAESQQATDAELNAGSPSEAEDLVATKEPAQAAATRAPEALVTAEIEVQTADQTEANPANEANEVVETVEPLAENESTVEQDSPETDKQPTEAEGQTEPAPADTDTALAVNETIAEHTEPDELQQAEREDPLMKAYRSNILTVTYQNLIYPASAIDRGYQGKIKLKLTLSRKGRVKHFDFTQKSKYNSLNKAVEKAVSAANPYPAPPRKLRGKEVVVEVPITFSLSS